MWRPSRKVEKEPWRDRAKAKLERMLALVLMFGLLIWSRCFGQALHETHLTVDSGMMAQLGRIADTATIEHFRCLLGRDGGDSLLVDVAYEPIIFHADQHFVSPAQCPVATVGTWHNHIPILFPILNGDTARYIKVSPRSRCFLSQTDSFPAQHGPARLTVVQVVDTVACAWIREGKTLQRVHQ